MALILSVDCGQCMIRNDRLEMEMTAQVQGMAPQHYNFNVSHKKHAVSSYKTNWTPPPSADVNTLVNMSEGDFMNAFSEYGRLLAAKMKNQDNATFNPSAPNNRILTRGIAFSSDVEHLGGDVHCFPFNISPVQTPKCISINKVTFENFKKVARFLYRVGSAVQTADAQNGWNAIETLVTGRVGQPNELLSQMEVQNLKVRFQGNGMDQRVKAELGAIKKADNLGKRPNPQPNRPPFRSGW